jgi:putative ubiquitin-RnfH superfamily antitoxin RatB of RatAB toxin-antitoxin module
VSATIQVEVVFARRDRQYLEKLELDAGAVVADALEAVAGRPPFDALNLDAMPVGIFGDRVDRQQPLNDGDRVELYRPLEIDPREARRRRAAER